MKNLDMDKVELSFRKFVEIVQALRHPENGCPWDLKQTHQTLRKYMIEEAYEAADVMAGDDAAAMIEELGDVMLQVVLNSQLLADEGRGSIVDVMEGISSKMIRRHPHVFDPSFGKKTISEIKQNWQEIKKQEKSRESYEGVFSKLKSPTVPALMHAVQIGKKAHEINFDWQSSHQVMEKVREELEELTVEIEQEKSSEERIESELGDLLFSISQLARHLGIDPELAAAKGNQKFLKRFEKVEELARNKSLKLEDLSQETLEDLWVEAKKGPE